ncbi:MAG: TfoX/Sxy family protein [Candidatus Dormibacterales bacterium]
MKAEVSDAGREGYEALAAELSREPGVIACSMFGMPSLKAGGRVFAGYHDGAMAFKLPEDERRRALQVEGAGPFDPSGRGRPMGDWARVPATAAASWPELARKALSHARAG